MHSDLPLNKWTFLKFSQVYNTTISFEINVSCDAVRRLVSDNEILSKAPAKLQGPKHLSTYTCMCKIVGYCARLCRRCIVYLRFFSTETRDSSSLHSRGAEEKARKDILLVIAKIGDMAVRSRLSQVESRVIQLFRFVRPLLYPSQVASIPSHVFFFTGHPFCVTHTK